jgi:hypothetical protein
VRYSGLDVEREILSKNQDVILVVPVTHPKFSHIINFKKNCPETFKGPEQPTHFENTQYS